MADKSVPINMRASDRWKRRLEAAANVLDVPASQIIRESVDEKLETLSKKKPALREALERVA